MTFESERGKAGGRIAAAALAGVSLLAFNTAFAQPADVQSATARPAGSVNVSVPAGSLESGLLSLGRQTNLRMLYPSNLTTGKRTAGVSGQMSPQQAVTQLLAGTGLRASFTGRNTVQVLDPSTPAAGGALPAGAIALDTIDVQGASNPNSTLGPPPAPYAGGQVATGGQVGMLGNRSVMNTPFSQTSYTNKTIQDQQARTVQDVLANDPSIMTSAKGGGSNDMGFFRGFPEQSVIGLRSLNGLQAIAPAQFPSTDYIERVEVLKGPSALLNGMPTSNTIGGSVNLVTKQADDEPLTQITGRYMSRSQFGTHVDVGRRFGDNKEFGVRFNGSLDGGNTPVDDQYSKFAATALNLDYRGDRVRLSADVAHQYQELNPDLSSLTLIPFISSLTHVPEAPANSMSLSPSWAKARQESTLGMIRGEVDILDDLTAYAAIGAQTFDYKREGINALSIADAAGQTATTSIAAYRVRSDTLSMQGGLRARVDTGPAAHALSLNLSQAHATYGFLSNTNGTINVGSIYNPSFGPTPTLPEHGPRPKTIETTMRSIGFADTLSVLDERIQFTAGVRYQEIANTNFNVASGQITSDYKSNAWTPSYSLLVKPWENVALYANYIEGLQQGTTVDGMFYANGGEVFPPYVAKQYEAGIKIDWGRVTTTLAAFQIAQPSAIAIPDPAGGLPTLALNGEQRNRGIELNAYGELLNGVRVLSGITLLDARQTKTTNGALDGERASGAPAFRAVLGGEWDTPFIEGLTLTGRFTYTSDVVVANNRPDLAIPSWTQADLGARYIFTSPWNDKPITVRFNVDNVFDDNYWKTMHTFGILYRSDPRTFRLSTTFKF